MVAHDFFFLSLHIKFYNVSIETLNWCKKTNTSISVIVLRILFTRLYPKPGQNKMNRTLCRSAESRIIHWFVKNFADSLEKRKITFFSDICSTFQGNFVTNEANISYSRYSLRFSTFSNTHGAIIKINVYLPNYFSQICPE